MGDKLPKGVKRKRVDPVASTSLKFVKEGRVGENEDGNDTALLRELGVDVYDQSRFEEGVIGQIETAMANKEIEDLKDELVKVRRDFAVQKENVYRAEKAVLAVKRIKNSSKVSVNSKLKELEDEVKKENKVLDAIQSRETDILKAVDTLEETLKSGAGSRKAKESDKVGMTGLEDESYLEDVEFEENQISSNQTGTSYQTKNKMPENEKTGS